MVPKYQVCGAEVLGQCCKELKPSTKEWQLQKWSRHFEFKSGIKDLTFHTGMSKTDMFMCLLFYHTELCGKPYFVKILSNKNHDIDVQSVIIIITSACIASAGGQGVLSGVL